MSSLIIATIVGTTLFVILLTLKPITERMFSKTWHYYMGLVPMFFLLGGVGVASMFAGFLGAPVPSILAVASNSVNFGETISTAGVGTGVGISNIFISSAGFYEATYVSYPSSTLISVVNLTALFTAIWAVGAVAFIAINVKRYFAYRHLLLRHSRPYLCEVCPVDIVVSKKATTPMVIGFIRPVVVLPNKALSHQELDMILAHELTHYRRKDAWIKLAILVARAAHWFNPAVHILSWHIHNLCELSCDENVVMEMSTHHRKLYGETILSMLQHGSDQRNLVCASGLCNSQKIIKRRLTNMLNFRKTRKIAAAMSLALAMIIVSVGAVVAHGLVADADECTTTTTSALVVSEAANDSFILEEDMTLYGQISGDIVVRRGTTLIIANGGQVNGTVFVDGTLYLQGGVITGASTRGVQINSGGVFNMMSGYVRGNSHADNGGGIWINGGTLYMHGGRIIENTSYSGGGGGVLVDGPESRFVIFGGDIMYNHSYYAGGGIKLSNGATSDNFVMHGGICDHNTITHFVPCYEECMCC